MVMTKHFLHIQDNHQASIGTCQVSYEVMSSKQSDWCHLIFGGTNIFLHSNISPDSFFVSLAHETTGFLATLGGYHYLGQHCFLFHFNSETLLKFLPNGISIESKNHLAHT